MKTTKIQYIAPECEEILIQPEGCIAASEIDPEYDGFNENEQRW